MKAKRLIIIGALGILTSHLAFAQSVPYHNYKGEIPVTPKPTYTQPVSTTQPQYKKVSCDGGSGCFSLFSSLTCDCTDPSCGGGVPCIDPCQCCRVFGNIGSGEFEPIGSGDP